MKAFWEVEETPSDASNLSVKDQQALDHFKDTYSRDDEGRYVVKLPRRLTAPELGNSREQAAKRFFQNEGSLNRKGQWGKFKEVFDEHSHLQHSELVPAGDLRKAEADCYYLPMHGVFKDASTTTKSRVVFNASAKSSSGYSFNDIHDYNK